MYWPSLAIFREVANKGERVVMANYVTHVPCNVKMHVLNAVHYKILKNSK
jgi:hypothetical protein